MFKKLAFQHQEDWMKLESEELHVFEENDFGSIVIRLNSIFNAEYASRAASRSKVSFLNYLIMK